MEKCQYDEKGSCSVHNRTFNPRQPGCAHWFDVCTLWCCAVGDDEEALEMILKEVSPAVVQDFCFQ